jgi:hypothetical protein
MNTFPPELKELSAGDCRFSEDDLILELNDGRTLTVPLVWYPRLFP